MEICEKVFGFELTFKTSDKLFLYKSADKGTLFILDKCDIKEEDIVLDLGYGYGLVGISCAKVIKGNNVIMCDIDFLAVEYSQLLQVFDVDRTCYK